MAIVVEFVGIPGAGKSTLVDAVTSRLESSGRRVVARPPLPSAARKVRVALANRAAMWSAVTTLVRSSRPVGQRAQAIRLVLSSFERYATAAEDHSDAVHLISEGSIQRLFLLRVDRGGVRTAGWERSVRAAPVADLVVHLDTSPATVRERLAGRERGLPPRLAGLDDDELDVLLRDAARLFEDALGLIADGVGPRGPRPTVIRVSDSRDPGPVLAALT